VVRRAASEALATAFLLAAVVGSGIMGEQLAGGNVAVALLANTLSTGAALVALACFSMVRNLDWRSSISLFEHEAKRDPSVADHHFNLCTAYFDAGQLASATRWARGIGPTGPAESRSAERSGNASVITSACFTNVGACTVMPVMNPRSK